MGVEMIRVGDDGVEEESKWTVLYVFITLSKN